MKYQRQYSQPFDRHIVVASVALTGSEACVSFCTTGKKFAERVGDELVCQMACEDYSVCAGQKVELWLYGIDNLYLYAAGEDLQNLIVGIASDLGLGEVVFADRRKPPE